MRGSLSRFARIPTPGGTRQAGRHCLLHSLMAALERSIGVPLGRSSYRTVLSEYLGYLNQALTIRAGPSVQSVCKTRHREMPKCNATSGNCPSPLSASSCKCGRLPRRCPKAASSPSAAQFSTVSQVRDHPSTARGPLRQSIPAETPSVNGVALRRR